MSELPRKLVLCFIEDNFISSNRLIEVIEQKYPGRFDIRDFATPTGALGFLRTSPVDVLITDMAYREGGGDVFRAILEARKRNPFCAIAAMTGFANAKMAAEVSGIWATDYRESTVDIGTGDAADTPAARERAASRNRPVTGQDVLKLISWTFLKPFPEEKMVGFLALVIDGAKDRDKASRSH